ncbi:hypothetical protein LSH36_184g07028 [Paralvinella palmiformis]|uniref:Uncharacterized protein n=1 Tax=Paralvinella palmiformis TaxID=53620 RepID=A0AAD9N8A4_9ANNE|nr:hypothetical protein LSH36_184g07028 [Paralvinella palmiformis]
MLGPMPAFVYVWHLYFLTQPSFQALLAITTTDYLAKAIFQDHCQFPERARILFTIWILVTVVALNSVYVKYVSRVQILLTFIKVVALIGIIIIGIYQLVNGETRILSTGFHDTTYSFGGHATAIHSGIFTYMGWQYVFTLIEEVKYPERVVPQATVISILTVTVLYTLTNVAYFTVMSPEDMTSSKAVALTFAEMTIGRFSKVVPFFVACSTIGSLNGAILAGSR